LEANSDSDYEGDEWGEEGWQEDDEWGNEKVCRYIVFTQDKFTWLFLDFLPSTIFTYNLQR
jgi:hypothetical protein